jgi:poly-gamma-glutamate synthesis protein (capsule biosynthesis protein)
VEKLAVRHRLKLTLLIATIFIASGYFPFYPGAAGAQERGSPLSPKFLESFFRNPEVYEAAFAQAGQPERIRIKAGIVSHHFLARELIAQFFAGIEPGDVKRVIILGPNHYRKYFPPDILAFTSLLPWKTPFGVVEPDRAFIQPLLRGEGCSVNDTAFLREHSVYILAPFLKKVFPQAEIVPLILRGSTDYDRFAALGARLRQPDPEGTILVVSSDFAHGVNREEAARLDRNSLARLKHLHRGDLAQVTCDCRAGLAVLRGFLGEGRPNFRLISHKTSQDFGSPEAHNLTSYVSAYFLKERDPKVKVLFVGDLMFDRYIRRAANHKGNDFIFQELADLLSDNDLVIANLEGPITDKPSISLSVGVKDARSLIFTFAESLALTLKKHNIGVVNLGNNHILNFGKAGLEETRRHLELAGVDYFGDPEAEDKRTLIKKINGLKIGLVNYNDFIEPDPDSTLEEIRGLTKQADLVVVYTHWGNEYEKRAGERIRRLAHDFIDEGADLVIGTHPHVVQQKEEYRGKMIYYSLGNFVFDQYHRKETVKGLAVKVTINPADLSLNFEEIPLKLERSGQTKLDEN